MEHVDEDRALLDSRVGRFYAAYAEAVDAGDIEALRAQVVDDVVITRPGQETSGVEAFLEVYRQVVAQAVPLTQHVVANVLADRDGDRIRARACFRALFFEGDATRLVVGRYVDDLVDGPNGLRFSHKRNVVQRVVTLPGATVVDTEEVI